jgi:hypothetical protein
MESRNKNIYRDHANEFEYYGHKRKVGVVVFRWNQFGGGSSV